MTDAIQIITIKGSDSTGSEFNLPPGSGKGVYLLVCELSENQEISIGKLGRFFFQKGEYLYVGSAFGPGGIGARVNHHLKISEKPHWHMDYLRKFVSIRELWLYETEKRLEHAWAHIFLNRPDARTPIPGFGSSDCMCKTHLFYLEKSLRSHSRNTTASSIDARSVRVALTGFDSSA